MPFVLRVWQLIAGGTLTAISYLRRKTAVNSGYKQPNPFTKGSTYSAKKYPHPLFCASGASGYRRRASPSAPPRGRACMVRPASPPVFFVAPSALFIWCSLALTPELIRLNAVNISEHITKPETHVVKFMCAKHAQNTHVQWFIRVFALHTNFTRPNPTERNPNHFR